MVVQHNLTAMNSNRMLGLTTNTQAKSTEKLSSGYKINRAADDAAGLSISEKMRKQIRGLTQASSNAQDGISAVQTAEGALNEVQDMLQRMNELAVKAANGTNSMDDRSYIQNEIDQLTTEIDRVAETTKFNETYLLKGNKQAAPEAAVAYKTNTLDENTTLYDKNGVELTDETLNKLIDAGEDFYKATKNVATSSNAALTVTSTGDLGVGTYTYDATDSKWKDNGGADVTAKITVTGTPAEADTITVTKVGDQVAGEADYNAGAPGKLYDADGNKISANALASYFEVKTDDQGVSTVTLKDGKTLYTDDKGTTPLDDTTLIQYVDATGTKTAALTLKLHVGADATDNNQISVDIDAMSADGLGVKNLKVDGADDTNAKNAIDTIKAAIQTVSTQRSALGAVQNRLEHTINNLDNVVENTTSAESQIRDTDMATEMVKYSNNNILSQAGQAMLAQANQSNQGVLSLLQ